MPPKKRVDSDNTLEKFVDNLRSLLSRINNGTDNLENLLGVVFPRGGWLLEQFVNNFINNRDINRRASMNNTAQSIPAADLLTEDNWNVIRDIYRGILNNKFINEFINKKESINKKTIDTILSILNMVKKHIENIVNYINEHYAPEYTSLVNKFKELLEQIADIKAKLDHIIIPPPKSHVRNSGAMFQPTNGAASSSSDLRPFTPKKRTTTSTKTRSAKRQKTQHPEEQVVNNDEVNLQSPQEQRLLGREKNRKAQMLNDAKSSAVSFNPVTPKNKTTKSSVTTKKKTANTSHASFAKHTEPKTPGNLAVNDKKNIQTPQAQRALLRGIGKLINEEEEVRGNLTDEESVAFLTLEQQLILQNQPPSDLPNVVPETQEQISDSVVNLEGQFDDVADNQPEFDLNAPDIDYQSEFDLNEDAPQEIEWFTDDEMNALLQHYFGNNDDVRLMVAINLFQHGGVLLRQNLEDLQLQQALEQSFTEQAPQRTIIVPINLGNTHWAALHIYFNTEDRTAPEINYFDPFGHRMPLELEEVLREVFTGLQPNDVLWYPIRFQYDGHNCGPWTIAILNSLVNNSGLPDEDFNVNDARIMYRDILRQTVIGAVQPMAARISIDRNLQDGEAMLGILNTEAIDLDGDVTAIETNSEIIHLQQRVREQFLNANEPSAIQEIAGDGNCFYRSIALILYGRDALNDDAAYLGVRKLVADYLERNRQQLEGYYNRWPNDKKKDRNFDQYIHDVRTNSNQWAGELEVISLIKILKRPIYTVEISSSDGASETGVTNCQQVHNINANNPLKMDEPIFVHYDRKKQHYRAYVLGSIVEETEPLPSSSSPKSYLPQFNAAQNEQHQIQNNAADFGIHFEVPDSANVRLADRVVDNTTVPESTVNEPEEGLEVHRDTVDINEDIAMEAMLFAARDQFFIEAEAEIEELLAEERDQFLLEAEAEVEAMFIEESPTSPKRGPGI
jgi:hypothetical protein